MPKVQIFAFLIFIYLGCFGLSQQDVLNFRPNGPVVNFPNWAKVQNGVYYSSFAFDKSGKEGWCVGDNEILHYKNGRWQTDSSVKAIAENAHMYGITICNNGELWVAGFEIVLHYKDGIWRLDTIGIKKDKESSDFFTNISGNSEDNLWIGGIESIKHYQRGKWLNDTAGLGSSFLDIKSLNSLPDGTVWALSFNGVIRHYSNHRWTKDTITKDLHNAKLISTLTSDIDGSIWATGTGIVLHRINQTWKIDSLASALLKNRNLKFFAVGNNGDILAGGKHIVIRRKNGVWETDLEASKIASHNNLLAGYITADGNGWMTGIGCIFKYSNHVWEEDPVYRSSSNGDSLNAIAVQSNNSILVGGKDIILRYANDKWVTDSQGESVLRGLTINSLSVNQDNGEAWAVGDSVFMHLSNGQWVSNGFSKEMKNEHHLRTISMFQTKTGWLAGEHKIFRCDNGQDWNMDNEGTSLMEQDKINSFSSTTDNSEITWAVGNGIFRHSGNKWQKENFKLIDRKSVTLNSVSVVDSGNVWAVGDEGVLLHYLNGSWSEDTATEYLVGNEDLHSIYMLSDGSGWIISNNSYRNSNLYHYNKKEWHREDGGKLRGTFLSMAADAKGRLWLGTSDGNIFESSLQSLDHFEMSPGYADITKLVDSVQFRVPYAFSGFKISITPADDTLRNLLIPGTYNTMQSDQNRTLTVYFHKDANKALDLLQGKFAIIKTSVRLDSSLDIWQNFISSSFRVGSMPLTEKIIRTAMISGFGLITLNVIFLLMAIKISWFRKNIFTGDFANLVGLFSINHIITVPLLKWLHPLKMAVLGEYFEKIEDLSFLRQWTSNGGNKKYNPPQIGTEFQIDPIEELWDRISVNKAGTSRNQIWLILGRSGIGKSALLEQLTLKALSYKQKPLLIKLNSFDKEGLFLKALFYDNGGLDVEPATALGMVKNGGFFIFLDGLNESIDQEGVKEFIASVKAKNIVVLSSQFDPFWEGLTTTKIELKPFSKRQLGILLGNENVIVDKLMNATYLFDIIAPNDVVVSHDDIEVGFLPFTATLIVGYIARNNGKIPERRLTIYGDLMSKIIDDISYINLEKKAWMMFCANGQNIEPDNDTDNLDSIFLRKAKNAEILTTVILNGKIIYRFKHERIFRFLVASFLTKKDSVSLEQLHGQLIMSQGKLYWTDVIDFLGEFLGEDISDSKSKLKMYKDFLIQVGHFAPIILKKRLVVQWNRFCQSNKSLLDAAFDRLLLEIIIKEGEDV